MLDRRNLLKLGVAAPALLLPSRKLILPDAKAQWSSCGSGFCNNGSGSSWTGVTIDAIAPVATAVNAQTISLNMVVSASAGAMLIATHYTYSGHTGFQVTWTVGGTTQTFNAGSGTSNFDFVLTSDNGASTPAISLIGLINPTPGSGTLTLLFTSAPDDLVMEAITFIGVNTLSGISGAFTAPAFRTSTSSSASLTMPAVPGGLQFVCAGGISSSPTTWNAGTQIYSTNAGGVTWGTAVYQHATVTTTFSVGIGASVFWAAAGVIVNQQNVFSVSPTLNVSNPLTSGLAFAIPCLAAGTLTDLVTSKTASTAGGITTDTSGGYHGGIAVPGGSTTAKVDFGVWQPVGSGDFTIVALANPASGANQGALIGQCDTGAANFIDFLTNSSYAAANVAGQMSGGTFNGSALQGTNDVNPPIIANGSIHVGFIDGNYHCWAFRLASGVPSLWCDGRNVTSTAVNITGALTNVNQHLAIGNLGNYTGAPFSAGCTIVSALGFNSALADADVASITSNQFQVFN